SGGSACSVAAISTTATTVTTPVILTVASRARIAPTAIISPDDAQPRHRSHTTKARILLPLGPNGARATTKVEVPVFGPCWIVRQRKKNDRLATKIATSACVNDSPMATMTAPLTT